MFAVSFVRSCISQVPEQATIMDLAPVAMEKDTKAEKARENLGQNQATVPNPVTVEMDIKAENSSESS
ncbi:hypothetical protein DPMN_065449 [Dreissena polymorpha]|uniref:Uncharacterized protein n=1 Tax=Dreissena polymorpha TaxID=45954 RepID=A0A9D4BRB2_DREPO|nr:hypothetical protein DPMN_065449 [Dreissena polymorpha]